MFLDVLLLLSNFTLQSTDWIPLVSHNYYRPSRLIFGFGSFLGSFSHHNIMRLETRKMAEEKLHSFDELILHSFALNRFIEIAQWVSPKHSLCASGFQLIEAKCVQLFSSSLTGTSSDLPLKSQITQQLVFSAYALSLQRNPMHRHEPSNAQNTQQFAVRIINRK